MVGRKLFKTRICVLYRKGRCNRQNCSFAHGDAELRRYNTSSSFNGRRDYRAADLREKLGRQRSPPRLERDARDPLPSHGNTSPRLGKRSDWGHRKRQHFDSEHDFSGSLRLSDGAERQARERKPLSSEFKDIHDEQLKQVQSEIDMLEDHKQQLQIYLEESIQEADSLNSKIEELEMQLSTEKEECRRISSKLRKFVKANNRHARIQEELKRSQARLQRLGDQLGSDARAATTTASEEDVNINILSDEENFGNLLISPKIHMASSPRKNEKFGLMGIQKDQYKFSTSKKRMRGQMLETDERSKQASSEAGEWVGTVRSERHSRWDPHFAKRKNTEEIRTDANGISNKRPIINDGKPIRRKGNFNGASSGDEFKDVKSSRMAAGNMVDEIVEMDEKLEVKEISSNRIEGGSTHDNTTALPFPLPPPPPPPVAPNAYLQYKGKEETVDVVNDDDDDNDNDVDDDNDDDDEMLDVDIV